jgi:hypothetical protein
MSTTNADYTTIEGSVRREERRRRTKTLEARKEPQAYKKANRCGDR